MSWAPWSPVSCQYHTHTLEDLVGSCDLRVSSSWVPHIAWSVGSRAGKKLGQNFACRALLTLKPRVSLARSVLALINSVCSARVAGQARAAARWPLGLDHGVFEPCFLTNGNRAILTYAKFYRSCSVPILSELTSDMISVMSEA
jgi:hypothetical protein